MNRIVYLSFSALFVLSLCLWTDVGNAQLIQRRRVGPMQTVETTPAVPGQTAQAVPGEAGAGQHDLFLAHWIAADNQTEIQLNQFAQQRASSQEVKDFIQEMIRDHSELAAKIGQVINGANSAAMQRSGRIPYTAGYGGEQGTVPAAPGAAAAPQSGVQGTASPSPAAPSVPVPAGAPGAATAPARPNSGPAGVAGQGPVTSQPGATPSTPGSTDASGASMQHASANLQRAIDAQLAQNIEQKLGQKQGQEFDRCFMQGQIAGHVHMIATLEVAKDRASPQLKAILDDALKTAEKHLSQAESLVAKLEPQSSR